MHRTQISFHGTRNFGRQRPTISPRMCDCVATRPERRYLFAFWVRHTHTHAIQWTERREIFLGLFVLRTESSVTKNSRRHRWRVCLCSVFRLPNQNERRWCCAPKPTSVISHFKRTALISFHIFRSFVCWCGCGSRNPPVTLFFLYLSLTLFFSFVFGGRRFITCENYTRTGAQAKCADKKRCCRKFTDAREWVRCRRRGGGSEEKWWIVFGIGIRTENVRRINASQRTYFKWIREQGNADGEERRNKKERKNSNAHNDFGKRKMRILCANRNLRDVSSIPTWMMISTNCLTNRVRRITNATMPHEQK